MNTNTFKIFFQCSISLEGEQDHYINELNLAITRFCGMVNKQNLLCRS